ncbi:hypothetical protein [Haliangium ochraceum]|uniref:Uncharacterized protein n=1 Tax=Haliangium ochraceum (strain DSM 14365 / JCM 11303 / SMP-2) TaxID=502025 RepID=D0LZK4_HALO1|nr:hypothetical protein [Haliangium ochraceum]ACY17983.1 hypothetical protein Hoch_5500 [Haliangium ochraceum DSM 14365]
MTQTSSELLPGNSPARIGAYLGLVAGLAMLGYGLKILFGQSDTQVPFQVALCLGGLLQMLTSFFAIKRQRAAWAFALSLNGTLTVIFLFGATRLRDAFDVHVFLGLLPALVYAAVTILLAAGTEEYGN